MYDGIINVYKEPGYTSFDVVAKLRGILHQKKIGHTGTLDPQAEGVLVVCLGKATKLCDILPDHDKEYEAVLLLGTTTDTEDMTGTVLTEQPVDVTEEQVRQVIASYVGTYEQVPPMYSAIKVNGKKLYEYARNGEEVEIKERDIEIMMIELIDFSNNEILRFSKKFKDILNELIQKDYKLEKASVNFVVYWEKQEDKKEAKIVLPKVVFKKV